MPKIIIKVLDKYLTLIYISDGIRDYKPSSIRGKYLKSLIINPKTGNNTGLYRCISNVTYCSRFELI